MYLLVCLLMSDRSLRALETVVMETPAALAISSMDVCLSLLSITSNLFFLVLSVVKW